jgi:serine/threonine protein kinase
MPADPGRVLSERYRLGELLGRGGMAEVRAGEDLRLGRDVAIKILRPELSSEPSLRERFESEARMAARLSHPNVVSIYDSGEDGDTAYIVMERLPGTTLADEVEAGPVPLHRVRLVARQILAALAAAHAAGIIHRDIKPANVLTCPDGSVKVTDFGIATVAGAASNVTAAGVILGTPAYLAPERVEGAAADIRSDIYSVGALLYAALTGSKPFEGGNALVVAALVRDSQPRALSLLRPDTPPALAVIVEKAMAKAPGDRFASAAEMAAALETSSVAPAPTAEADEATTVIAPAGLPPVGATQSLGPLEVPGPPVWERPSGPGGVRKAPAGAPLSELWADVVLWGKRQSLIRVGVALLALLLLVALVVDVTRGGSGSNPPPGVGSTSSVPSTTSLTTTLPPTTLPSTTLPPTTAPTLPPATAPVPPGPKGGPPGPGHGKAGGG